MKFLATLNIILCSFTLQSQVTVTVPLSIGDARILKTEINYNNGHILVLASTRYGKNEYIILDKNRKVIKREQLPIKGLHIKAITHVENDFYLFTGLVKDELRVIKCSVTNKFQVGYYSIPTSNKFKFLGLTESDENAFLLFLDKKSNSVEAMSFSGYVFDKHQITLSPDLFNELRGVNSQSTNLAEVFSEKNIDLNKLYYLKSIETFAFVLEQIDGSTKLILIRVDGNGNRSVTLRNPVGKYSYQSNSYIVDKFLVKISSSVTEYHHVIYDLKDLKTISSYSFKEGDSVRMALTPPILVGSHTSVFNKPTKDKEEIITSTKDLLSSINKGTRISAGMIENQKLLLFLGSFSEVYEMKGQYVAPNYKVLNSRFSGFFTCINPVSGEICDNTSVSKSEFIRLFRNCFRNYELPHILIKSNNQYLLIRTDSSYQELLLTFHS